MRTPIKTRLIQKYIDERIGQEFEMNQIATSVGCAVQLVYYFKRKNPQRFTKVKHKIWRINPVNNQVFSNNQVTI